MVFEGVFPQLSLIQAYYCLVCKWLLFPDSTRRESVRGQIQEE